MVLVIDIGGLSPEELVPYYRGQLGGANHLYATDRGFEVGEAYQALSLGTTVVIDASGTITYRDSSTTRAEVLLSEIRKALR